MHVLYVSADPGVPVLGHKGASVHVRELSEALVGAGARVTIASPRIAPEGDRLAPSVALTAIPPILPREHESETTLRAAMLMQRSMLATVARRLRVDAIYERYSLFTHAGVEVAAELGVCHVLEVNAPLRAEAERFRTLPHPLVAECIEQHVFERTERILTVSPPLAELVRRAGVAAEKIEVLPNAVAPGKFRPRRSRSDDLLVAGFVGSLKPWHGIDVLVAAAHIALAADPRVRLEMIGAGPMATLFEGGLANDRVVLHGALEHAEAIKRMRGWDVGLAPYNSLPDFYFSPLKLVEYMAVGLCPIASALGMIPSLLADGQFGVLVSPDDPEALAAALLALAEDPERAHRLGAAARAHALSTRTWARNAARVLGMLGGRPSEAAA